MLLIFVLNIFIFDVIFVIYLELHVIFVIYLDFDIIFDFHFVSLCMIYSSTFSHSYFDRLLCCILTL